jgi:hypothetical protein
MAKDEFKNLGFVEPHPQETEKTLKQSEEEKKKPGELRW